MKTVAVPQRDLDQLEEARKELWELFPQLASMPMRVTGIMWRLSHYKYPVVEGGEE